MSQDNIFREVDEELRSDRMRAFWRRFAPYILGAAVGVVLIVAINEGWSWYQSSNAAQSSDELYAAFDLADGGDLAAAQTELDRLIADGSGGYPVLAQFRKAGLLAKEGKAAEAVAVYDELANTQSNPRLRELALVFAGTLLVDNGTLADVQTRVETIATEGNPLRNAAREAMGLAQYKAGDFAAAQASFESVLNDPLTQNTTRQRMGYYLGQMVSEGVIAPEPIPDSEATLQSSETVVVDEAAPVEPAAEAPAPEAAAPAAPEAVAPAAPATGAPAATAPAAPAPATPTTDPVLE
ncbi:MULTISPECIES: tetratricopeptide repeat protein [unclassified Devosia]|uniref:tetratricopeptide repeat protein n=1 Tax=unclassified Devosia TaxID=196773 RepID=UPI0015538C70|nr:MULTISPECIES: tetratricopeptide repeat protein [unclassified Devosia]